MHDLVSGNQLKIDTITYLEDRQDILFNATNISIINSSYIYSKKVRHNNIKILLSLSEIYKAKVWNQKLNQECIQARDLKRAVYVIPASRFNFPQNTVLKLLKPLYALTESGDSFFNEDMSNMKKKLGFRYTAGDNSYSVVIQ